jgi:hypothetical protein
VAFTNESSRDDVAGFQCYAFLMGLPFDPKACRAYGIEFGASGQRLGCKFLLDDGSLLFVNESEITPEIDSLMASLGSPTDGLTHNGNPNAKHRMKRP